MMSKNLFVQIGMIVLSVGIIITFVEPTFTKIGELQDDIVVYQAEQDKVSGVNAQLSSLIGVLNSVPAADQRKLLRYMPDEVDTISVVRDLLLISEEAGVVYLSAAPAGEADSLQDQEERLSSSVALPREYLFNLSVEATYDQMKTLFRLIEQNDYPLEVHGVSVATKEGGFLTVDISLSAYAHNDGAPSKESES